MALAPKTKLWIGVGIFSLLVIGLLSLNSDTFSGNLSLVITQANPELCVELKNACAEKGPGSPACDNYKKIMCTEEIEKGAEPASIGEEPASTPLRPRGRVTTPPAEISPSAAIDTRGAAPSPSDNSTTPNNVDQADLDKALGIFQEAPSQGQLDTSTMH